MSDLSTLERPSTAAPAAAAVPYLARQFTPAHPDLANGAGAPAKLANERYVSALARIIYVWGHPLVNTFRRTSTWELRSSDPHEGFRRFWRSRSDLGPRHQGKWLGTRDVLRPLGK